jgi:predicted O-linked N-acetylglucosamine transferase (SPINDLY family)
VPAADALLIAELQQRAQQLHAARRFAEAEAVLRRLLELGPQPAAVLTNHGLVLSLLGRLTEAEAQHRRAIAADPALAAAWVNLAVALRQLGRLPEAAQAEQQALKLAPESPEAHVNAGLSLHAQCRLLESIAAYRHALGLRRDLPEAWIDLGIALQETGDPVAACEAFAQALALAPRELRAASNLLMAMQYRADLNAAVLRDAAARCGSLWPQDETAPEFNATSGGSRRLKIGYVGGDFRRHPVGWMLLPVLREHDRERFEVHLFDSRPPAEDDDVAAAIRGSVEHWHPVAAIDDDGLLALIRGLGIDVLVDLAGHTEHHRLGVFARRAAPVQLSWLGYFASTGLAAMDAIVLGRDIAGAGAAAWSTEPVRTLPRLHLAYAPPAYAPALAACPSLASGSVTFGSFNNAAKLGDDVVRTWAAVLDAVAGSRLVLKWKCWADPAFAEHTRRRFAQHGIDGSRIDLRPASPHEQMLGEYADIDIALDPFPFSGALTTLEALWMGVPVVTLPWQRPVSRQTAALLHAIGLDDLVAVNPRDYAARAAALAADAERRQQLRAGLRDLVRRSEIGDGRGLAREVEALFVAMLGSKCGEPPATTAEAP